MGIKSKGTRAKMSWARKEWYQNHPKEAKDKSKKMSETKKRLGTWKGKDNPNFGSKKFTGIPYKGPSWWRVKSKKEIRIAKKKHSEINMNEKNPYWKGNKVTYSPLHDWIRRHKPKPKLCEDCKKVPPYDLANISGKYKRDIKDFKWVCRKCHMKEDGRIYNLKNQKGGKNRGNYNCKKRCS